MENKIFKFLPNELIIKIIKMKVEEERKAYWRKRFTEEIIDEIKMVHDPLYWGGLKGYFKHINGE